MGGVSAATTAVGSTSLKSALARLRDLERAQLQQLWRGLYGSDPPEQISRQLLLQGVAHRLQVKALGGLTRRALEKAGEDIASERATRWAGRGLDTGVVLIRVWRGETHQVTTLKEGVQYRGK